MLQIAVSTYRKVGVFISLLGAVHLGFMGYLYFWQERGSLEHSDWYVSSTD
jgi:hypothetical protein